MIRWAAVMLLAFPFSGQAQDEATTGKGAGLRALDKVNGQTLDLELNSGQVSAAFGLEIDLIECRYPTDNPTGDAYAYMAIRDEGSQDIAFEGWMIASSPALSAMDHARYDVWVLRCITS
ncbi:MAG: DUF2155 domain-containing protein [Paracoccaceae bacterium]